MKVIVIRLALTVGLICSLQAQAGTYSVSDFEAGAQPSITDPAKLPTFDRHLAPSGIDLPRKLPKIASDPKFDIETYQPDNPRHLLDRALDEEDRGASGLGPCKSFSGATYTGWDPPDPQIAVGPNHIVEVVNSSISVFDKTTGNLLLSAPAQFWFAGVQPTPQEAGDSDCNVIVNVSDAVRVIGYIFSGGVAPCGPC